MLVFSDCYIFCFTNAMGAIISQSKPFSPGYHKSNKTKTVYNYVYIRVYRLYIFYIYNDLYKYIYPFIYIIYMA